MQRLAHENLEIKERKESVVSILHNSEIVLIVTGVVSFIACNFIWFDLQLDLFLALIRKLNIAIEKVGRGDLTVKTEIESNDEIGNLSRAFNKMTN